MTDAEIKAYSYTAATGKRPRLDTQQDEPAWHWQPPHYEYFESEAKYAVPAAIWFRMEENRWPSRAAALAAADEAWRRARRDGAIGAEGGGA